jgi:hypothetical protein
MKVTFTCEKCGKVVSVWHEQTVETFLENVNDDKAEALDFTCPVCSQPTYGPLTVEMVAEALWEAQRSEYQTDWAGLRRTCDHAIVVMQQARFVLRLLEKSPGDISAACTILDAVDWRDWLLKMAREK